MKATISPPIERIVTIEMTEAEADALYAWVRINNCAPSNRAAPNRSIDWKVYIALQALRA